MKIKKRKKFTVLELDKVQAIESLKCLKEIDYFWALVYT